MDDKIVFSPQTVDEYIEWKLFQDRVLWLEDSLEEYNTAEVCEKLEVLAKESAEPIKIVIQSPGGHVFAAMALYDTILRVRKQFGIWVITEARGYAASSAAIILQAGSRRTATEHTRILIHEVSTFKFFSNEKASDVAEESEELQKVNDMLVQILSEKTGHSEQELKTLMHKKDVWFNAQEALAFNLIDAVV